MTGRPIDPTTPNRWVREERAIPAIAEALILTLRENPVLLVE